MDCSPLSNGDELELSYSTLSRVLLVESNQLFGFAGLKIAIDRDSSSEIFLNHCILFESA